MTTKSPVTTGRSSDELSELEPTLEYVGYDFGMSRRAFVKGLGAGLCIAVSLPALPQEKEGGQRSRNNFLGKTTATSGGVSSSRSRKCRPGS